MPTVTSAATLLARLASFDWDKWNKSLAKDLKTPYRDLVLASGKRAADAAGGMWKADDPFLTRFMTGYVGERVKQLGKTSRKDVTEIIRRTFADPEAKKDPHSIANLVLDKVREKYDGYEEWRALRIARSEVGIGANHGSCFGIAQAGGGHVDVFDGTDDEICKEANGQTWTIAEALNDPLGHPNCTRSLAPSKEDERKPEHYERWAQGIDVDLLALFCAEAAEEIASREDPHAATRVMEDEND